MLKPLKFSSRTHKFLWVSDMHQQHQPSWVDTPPLWKSRGFSSIIEHDSWLRDQWHTIVDADTIVFNLGDSVFSDPKGERFRQLTMWSGDQRLVNGNHWSGQKQIYDGAISAAVLPGAARWIYPVKVNNLTYMGDQLHVFIDGQSVYMQHYAPYIWPELGAGGFACCGHSHGRAVDLNPDCVTFGKALDIGVDNAIAFNGTPFFSWDEVKRIMSHKPVVKRDHH